MRALVQRVLAASVRVDGDVVGEIGAGLLVLLGVARGDTAAQATAAAAKVHGLRILRDDRSLADSPGAAALVVSQFTLYGDTRKGRRPSWSAAAGGADAEPLVAVFAAALGQRGTRVATGVFGADMQVELINDGR